MKHLTKSSLYLVALVVTGCLFYACSDEELSDVSTPAQEADFTVRAKNGYLEFKDQATFDQVKASLENMDDEALNAWESQFEGFTSLRSMAVQAIDAQEDRYEYLSTLDEGDLKNLRHDNNIFYSDFIKNRPSIFIMQDSGRYHLNMPIKDSELEGFINTRGLLKVGDNLYEYKKETIKVIHDGNESKLSLLSELANSSEKYGITVHHVDEKLVAFDTEGITARFANNASCAGTAGDERVKGEAYRSLDYKYDFKGEHCGPQQFRVRYFFSVYMYALREKGLFGGWIQKRTKSLRANGKVTITSPLFATKSLDINVVQSNFRYDYRKTVWASNEYCFDNFHPDASPNSRPRFVGEITFRGRGGSNCTI